MTIRFGPLVLTYLLVISNGASADESIHTLAISGAWMAAAHSVSMTAAPDVCLVANAERHVAFRYGSDGAEFRVSNEDWSLPPGVEGEVGVAIGSYNKNLKIANNTDHTVAASIDEVDLPNLFSAMDKASSMTVTVGKAKPFAVSLSGSTKATNAFRTCAGIHSNTGTPGSNPFQ